MKKGILLAGMIFALLAAACSSSGLSDADIQKTAIAEALGQSEPATQDMPQPGEQLPTNTPLPPPTNSPTPQPPQPTQAVEATSASCIPGNPPQTGRVVDVVDGDTIKVILDQDGMTYSVRYIGMDTPENTSQVEYFGPEATVKNTELVNGKVVTLIKDVSETDRYGRLLRYVLADDIFVNYELVVQGYANTASYPPDIACIPTFQEAERQASAAKLGLWAAPPTATPFPTFAPLPTQTSSSGSGGSGDNAVCSCSSNTYNCADFASHASAQACYNYCISIGRGDVHRLDADSDGVACESLP